MSHNWKNTLLAPHATISQAIQALDSESLRIVLVVDDRSKLLGVVTDGDIRRALLKRMTLEAPLSEVMNKSPKTATVDDSKVQILSLMTRFDLLQIPLLDKNGIVIGIETFQHLKESKKNENPVFLMAGGFGKRLRPLTDDTPKPLLKVGSKPILETIVEQFADAGFYRIFISTHYLPEKIKDYFGDGAKWGVEIQYVHEDSPLGTGGALGLLPSSLPDLPIIVMNGDILTKIDFARLLTYHQGNDAVATMCVREYEFQVPYGVVQIANDRVTGMVEKPSHQFFVNAGIYVIGREVINSVAKNQKVDMPTLLEQHIQEGKKVSVFPIHEYWLDIGKKNDFEQAQKDFFET